MHVPFARTFLTQISTLCVCVAILNIGTVLGKAPSIRGDSGGILQLEATDVQLNGNISMMALISRLALVEENLRELDALKEQLSTAAEPANTTSDCLPGGTIVLWYAATGIPAGWVICNGSNGTPDLRSRFPYGAATSSEVLQEGGSETVTLTESQMPAHGHSTASLSVTDGANIYVGNARTSIYSPYSQMRRNTGTAQLSPNGGNQPHDNMPPYVKLFYIMKT